MTDSTLTTGDLLSAILKRLDANDDRAKKSARKVNREIRALKEQSKRAAGEDKASKKEAKRAKKAESARQAEQEKLKAAEVQKQETQRDAFGEILASLPAEARAELEKSAAEAPAVKKAITALWSHVAPKSQTTATAPSAPAAQTTSAPNVRGPGPAQVISISRPRSAEEFAKRDKAERDALLADPAFHLDELPPAIRA